VRVAVGSDHAGFPLKQRIVDELRRLGHEPIGVGLPPLRR